MSSSGVLKVLLFVLGFGVLLTLGMTLVSSASTVGFIAGIVVLIGTAVGFLPSAYRFVVDNAKRINRTLGILLIAAFVSVMSGCGYSRVEPGHVGIKVHLYGSDKGVDFEPIKVGAYWYNPWYTSFYEFPVYVQTATWTQSPTEGGPNDESITFNTKEGMVINADISLSYHLDGEKVPAYFANFGRDKLSVFTHGFMRNVARDAFNDIGPTYTVEEVYGEKKEELRKKVMVRIHEQVNEFGVILEQFGYTGALRLPEKVVASLNGKIQATQDAMRIQNEVAQATAEALKTVATAEGAAKARTIQAKAEADANRIVAASVTPELIQYEIARKWDGHRPMVEGSGSGLLLSLNPSTLGDKTK